MSHDDLAQRHEQIHVFLTQRWPGVSIIELFIDDGAIQVTIRCQWCKGEIWWDSFDDALYFASAKDIRRWERHGFDVGWDSHLQ